MSGELQQGQNLFGVMALGANAPGTKIVYGQHITVAASDTVATGLSSVRAVFVTLKSDPILAADRVTADISGGSILIKTWKPTGTGDTTPVAATTFSRVVHYVAIGV